MLQTIVKQGYYSGGGGYVLSRESLRRFGERPEKLCAHDHGAEDVEMGRCMEKLGVKTKASVDNLGELGGLLCSTFMCCWLPVLPGLRI